jgi:hypothetical protein
MGTTAPATAPGEMGRTGRKYTLFGSLAVLAVPVLLCWALLTFLVLGLIHPHDVLKLVGEK